MSEETEKSSVRPSAHLVFQLIKPFLLPHSPPNPTPCSSSWACKKKRDSLSHTYFLICFPSSPYFLNVSPLPLPLPLPPITPA